MGKKQTIGRKRMSCSISTSCSSSGNSDTPETPIKSATPTPSDSQILCCSPRPRRSSSSNNNIEGEGVVLVDGQQERGAAAAAAAEDPESKKKDKKRKMQQPASSASASAAAEKSRQQQQEEEAAAAAVAAAAVHPKLTMEKDVKRKMQQPASAEADPKSKKKDKMRKMQQPASAASEKSRQLQQEEEAAAAVAAAAVQPKLTMKKDVMQQSSAAASASEKEKYSSSATSIWSVEDEIKVLQGIMDDAKRNNGLPLHYNRKNAETFLEAIGPSLGIHPTVHQLERKIRYMKETYANAPAAKKSMATGHKKLLYDLCDQIWLPPSCYVAEKAQVKATDKAEVIAGEKKSQVKAAGEKKSQAKDDDSKSKGDYNYPELKIALERQGGYLVFEEVVSALGEEMARRTDEQFGMLRNKEKKQWKLIHECL